MTAVATRPASTFDFPRFALLLDATTALPSAVLLIVGARPIRDFLGIGSAEPLVILSVVFALYAALLLLAANRHPVARRSVLMPAILNTVWVIGSITMLVSGTPAFSTGGKWAVALVADIVGIIAVLQFVALRRIPRANA